MLGLSYNKARVTQNKIYTVGGGGRGVKLQLQSLRDYNCGEPQLLGSYTYTVKATEGSLPQLKGGRPAENKGDTS